MSQSNVPCPKCGYLPLSEIKPLNNAMNTYIEKSTGKVWGVLNSDAEALTIKGVDLVRQDKYQKPQAPANPTVPPGKPTVPTTPSK